MQQLNIEVLRNNFEKAGFPVQRADKVDMGGGIGHFFFEFNFPDPKSCIAMRSAFAKMALKRFHGDKISEVGTYHKFQESSDAVGDLASRDRVILSTINDEELRIIFNDVIDQYTKFMEERFGPENESSYRKETRVRKGLYDRG